MRRNLCIAALWALVLVLLTLVACGTQPGTPTASNVGILLGTPVGTNDQETQAAALTLEMGYAANQAAATAKIERANAQATLNSANATLSAAQTQDQNNANAIAAQLAATAVFARANAQATLYSANSTQNAALTQDAIQQAQVQYDLQTTEVAGTQSAEGASTQTEVANQIATQTRAAAATSQWYADQARQRGEQRLGSITFLWVWCLPIFFVLLAVMALWGFWRWLKIRQANQRILEKPVDKLQPPAAEVIHHPIEIIDSHDRLTKPDNQVPQWLDEVKRKLLSRDKKDEDDNPDD